MSKHNFYADAPDMDTYFQLLEEDNERLRNIIKGLVAMVVVLGVTLILKFVL
jgi:hypothetical protein